jgi:hypothetical protein
MALLQAVSTAAITRLLAWHCLKGRHGVVVHVAIIVMDDLMLLYNQQEYLSKQTALNSLKVEILPVLFAGRRPCLFLFSMCIHGCLGYWSACTTYLRVAGTASLV